MEETIRRSRFITTLGRAEDEDAARAFVDAVEAEFPDATHNCWAYVAGPPGSTARVGMSDDGEPHQTAGRPMLTALLHSGVGEVVAVVTRYYGGVKLGRGGLGRAYSGGVQLALGSLPVLEKVDRVRVGIRVGYPVVDVVLRLLDARGVDRVSERWGAEVELELDVPADGVREVLAALQELTAGGIEVQVRPEE